MNYKKIRKVLIITNIVVIILSLSIILAIRTKRSGQIVTNSATIQSPSVKAGRIYQLHKEYREAVGLPILKRDPVLELVAKLKASEMTDDQGNVIFWAHEDPLDGKIHTWDYLYSFGKYDFVGENLSLGNTPDQAMAQWLYSPSHLANIEDVNYTRMGVYVTKKDLIVVIFSSDKK